MYAGPNADKALVTAGIESSPRKPSHFIGQHNTRAIIRSGLGALKAARTMDIAPVLSKVAPVRINLKILCGPRIAQIFQPECKQAIPSVRFRYLVFSNPALFIMPKKVSWSGNFLIDSTKYW